MWPVLPSNVAPTGELCFQFAELLSDRLTADLVAKAMTGHVNDYEL
jgi:LysR family cys regulon transcriptional activator